MTVQHTPEGQLRPPDVPGAPTPPPAPVGRFSELILDPEQLVANCRGWNEKYAWGLSAGDFQRLPEPPQVPDEPFCTLVLTPCPPDAEKITGLQRGFDDLWMATASQQPKAWRWSELHSDPDSLQLLESVTYEPGLVWEVLDLGAHWDRTDGIAPHRVRDPKISPHLGILAATAHYPRYVPTMNGATRPFLWIPGLHATVPGHDRWRHVPFVDWLVIDREVRLDALWDGNRDPGYAVPVRREK